MRGERIALLGQPRDGPLAHRVAALGARVMTSVGATTTILLVAGPDPQARALRTHPARLKAEAYRRDGGAIRILGEADLDALLHRV